MNVVNEIRRQYRQGEWKQFLESVEITNIHGWTDQEVSFRFPIVAIVGENGVGKSTVLKASACAYKNESGDTFYPSQMFVRTKWDETAYANAIIRYVVDQGGNERRLKWQKKKGWGFSPKGKNGSGQPKRNVFFLDISRTLPLDATAGYAKIAKQATAEIGAADVLSESLVRDLSYVLGRDYAEARFVGTDVYPERRVGLVTKTVSDRDAEISQFHQGAGEHSLLNLFRLLADIPQQSLLLIDEIENSLHPQAQRRLTEQLLDLCRSKKIQVILTTHSPYVLEELPPEARVMLLPSNTGVEVMYEVSPEFALTAIDDRKHPEMRVYLEDREAETMFWEILRKDAQSYAELRSKIRTYPVGTSSVVETLDRLGRENKLGYRCMGVVDADVPSGESAKHSCLHLPGSEAPEKEVLHALREKGWKGLDGRFGLGAGTLFKYLDDALRHKDHHTWTSYIGDQLSRSKDSVWDVLVEEWSKSCLGEADAALFIASVKDRLDA